MKQRKRIAAFVLAAAMVFSILPMNALAVETQNVDYLDADGKQQTKNNVTVVESTMTQWDGGWYVVNSTNSTVEIGSRVTVNGDVHLILAADCELIAKEGIQVTYPSSLTIYGQSAGSGKLTAQVVSNGTNAAIGGRVYTNAGDITINGGNVTARGGDASAGIGGGPVASGGNIVINGGTVNATSSGSGAGIGGGMQCAGGRVTINGGDVTATGGAQAAGIGSGALGSTSGDSNVSVLIHGGTVTATGGEQGAGIGDGMADKNMPAKVASITITGGTVTAKGGDQGMGRQSAAGIGGGAQTPGGEITISGGTVMATGADGASGIGHGGLGATGGKITISGGTVTATGGSGNPGISCQDPTNGPIGQEGWILISGGTVYASPKAGEEASRPAIRGSFRTGDAGNPGNAFVVASGNGITDKTNQENWSGVIFNGDGDGKVYGNPTLETDAKTPDGKKLTIPEGSSLTVSPGTKLELTNSTLTVGSGATLTNNGTISGDGKSEVKVDDGGKLDGSGTAEGNITVPPKKNSAVSISPSSAVYGSQVTLIARISQDPASRTRKTLSAKQGQVDFYLGTKDASSKLGTAEVIDDTAQLEITLSGETWAKGFQIGKNTIIAEYGGSMVLDAGTGSAPLMVTGDLEDATVQVSGDPVYTGSPITPDVTVTWNGTELTKDTDYTLAYENNTNAGKATVIVTGKGNYTGTARGTFDIKKATPTPTIPTGLTATYGQKLKDVPLPKKWAWNAPDTSVGDAEEKTFPATYTEDDSDNYNEVQENLTVTVNPVSYTIMLTGQANSPIQITLDEAVVAPANTGTTVTYGCSTTNKAPDNWQEGRVFSGLTADTTYYFFARAEATKNYAETISQGVAISTPEKAVSAIKITHQPDNLSYTSGQTLNLSGLSVQVKYEDNGSKTLTWASGKLTANLEQETVAQGTVLKVAKHNGKKITISYGGKTAETDALTVEKAAQVGLSITGAPDKIDNGSSFTLKTSGGSGTGAVKWEIVSGPATVDKNGKVTVTGTGEFQIKAVKDGDVEYKPAEVVITLTAGHKPSSGGGGSSSSNEGADSTIIDRPDKNDPNAPTTGQTAPVKPGTNGKANINGSTVQQAIDKAVADAKKNGNTANGIAVVVPVNVGDTLKDVQIILKADTLDKLVSSNVKQFTIDTDRMADFGFALDTLEELNRQTSGDIIFKVKKTAVSSAEAKAAIGNRPVYDISLWEVENSKETRLASLNGKTIRIAIPYTPAKGEQAGNLYAASVDAAGKVQWITKSSYHADKKAVIFQLTQSGIYGVGYDAKTPAFTDIANHWAKDNILFVVSRGLLNGTSATTFSPDTGMTRGMFVTALGRLAGVDPADYQSGKFTDVKADAYYAPYVNWAASKGIVKGTTDTTFAPDSNINREQMAVIMKNYAAKLGYTVPQTLEAVNFADNASISSWAKEEVKSMQQAGILTGKTNNCFDPAGTATRAEVATVLRRFVEIIIDPQTDNN